MQVFEDLHVCRGCFVLFFELFGEKHAFNLKSFSLRTLELLSPLSFLCYYSGIVNIWCPSRFRRTT